jgi:hypothetical protein
MNFPLAPELQGNEPVSPSFSISRANMKTPKRSAKAPATGKGSLPGASSKRGRGYPDAKGGPDREQVRQTTRRVNVPRNSQRPAERSSQRRSRRP